MIRSWRRVLHQYRRRDWREGLTERGLIRRGQVWLFAAGLAAIALAMFSPIAALADKLFVMHMLQHILLIMVAPPLLLLGVPAPLIRLLIVEARLKGVLTRLTDPLFAYALFVVNLYLWHIPAAYEAALHDELVHAVEHAAFFYTAVLFSWRLIDPTRGWFPLWRWPPAKWIYLLVAAPPSYVLGSILWVSNAVLYPTYAQAPRVWDLTALQDQHMGGLLMWLQGWMVMMLSVIAFFRWYDPQTEQA